MPGWLVFLPFFFLAGFVAIKTCRAIHRLQREAFEKRWELFNQRWPPIDDYEILRRCRKGVRRGIALRFRRVISETTGIPYERIYPEQHFVNDLEF